MRTAFSDRNFLYAEDGTFIGINLGYDYCAEHEWGIKKINQSFGIDFRDEIFGIEKRKITHVPETLFFGKAKKKKKSEKVRYMLHFDSSSWFTKERLEETPFGMGHLYGEEFPFSTGWDQGSFAIITYKEKKKELKELYDAFLRQDVAIGTSGSLNPFAGSGLTIVIVSRMPKETLEKVYQTDKEKYELKMAAEATGIHEILKASGKGWYALSPRWSDEANSEVVFFLNPCEQQMYNHGWFTVDELKEWAENKGKVLKNIV